MDMSPAYSAGAEEFFPAARIVFDHIRLMHMAGQVLDEVRKSLRRAGTDLAGGPLVAARQPVGRAPRSSSRCARPCADNTPRRAGR